MKKRILTPTNRKIINEIAEEEGMFPKQIEDIVMAQFEYMKKMMPSDHAIQFKLPYLGKFQVTDKTFNKRKELIEKKYGSS